MCMLGKMTAQVFGGRRALCGLAVSGEEILLIGLSKQNREASYAGRFPRDPGRRV